MAEIKITIPNDKVQRVLAAFTEQYNYPENVPDPRLPPGPGVPMIPNPVSKPQFAKNIIKSFVKEVTVNWEAREAGEAARVAAFNTGVQEIEIED